MTETMSRRGMGYIELDDRFAVRARFEDPLPVAEMSRDLDLASRAAALDACTSVNHLDVLVDLSGLVFIDCAGYGALVAATSILDHREGSMVLINTVGGPRRLLTLIEELGLGLCAPLRYGTRSVSPAASSRHERQRADP